MIIPDACQDDRDVAGHYDELDRVYRDIWGEHVHHGYWRTGGESSAEAVEALVDLVADRLEPRAGERLCDIGCGYGATAARLSGRYGVHVTGFTVSAEQHELASRRLGALSFVLNDWLANSLPDGAFDRAYAIESSAHMVDKQLFFDEAFRTIRPGGRFVVCAWLASPRPAAWEIRHLLEPICREGRLPSMGSRDEYEAMAKQAGFEILGFEDVSRNVRRTWAVCAGRLMNRIATSSYYRRLIVSRRTRNRSFLLSLPRLMVAYRTGAMRYGVFTFYRPLTQCLVSTQSGHSR